MNDPEQNRWNASFPCSPPTAPALCSTWTCSGKRPDWFVEKDAGGRFDHLFAVRFQGSEGPPGPEGLRSGKVRRDTFRARRGTSSNDAGAGGAGPTPRSAQARLLIVCEGKRTEPNYFEGFRKEHRNVIISVCESQGKDPDPDRSLRHSRRPIRWTLGRSQGDSAWCVCEWTICMDKEIAEGRGYGRGRLELAVSNPCFELWFLLQFHVHRKADGYLPRGHRRASRHIPGYDKAGDHYDRLIHLARRQ